MNYKINSADSYIHMMIHDDLYIWEIKITNWSFWSFVFPFIILLIRFFIIMKFLLDKL